jgi:hypothetical protein
VASSAGLASFVIGLSSCTQEDQKTKEGEGSAIKSTRNPCAMAADGLSGRSLGGPALWPPQLAASSLCSIALSFAHASHCRGATAPARPRMATRPHRSIDSGSQSAICDRHHIPSKLVTAPHDERVGSGQAWPDNAVWRRRRDGRARPTGMRGAANCGGGCSLSLTQSRGSTLASLRRHLVVGHEALACEFLGTLTPSHCHSVPRRLALRISRKLGHLLAVGGVFQKFVRGVHRTVSLWVQYNQEIGWKVPRVEYF